MRVITQAVIVVVLLMFGLLSFAGVTIYREYRSYKLARERERVVVQPAPQVKITLIEGWTLKNIAGYLEKKLMMPDSSFMQAEKQFDVFKFNFLSDKPKNTGLEGYLFPDTYLVEEKAAADDIIAKLLKNFSGKVSVASAGVPSSSEGAFIYKIPGFESISSKGLTGLSLHDVVTMASIIEKETGVDLGKLDNNQAARLDDERKIIAGIFYNRLAIGQGLESDATINYISGKSDASASTKDLSIDSPYNTYRYSGLPPGPIANPSLSSLIAAFHPIKTGYYYFLHKQPSGEVVYSKTFEEHKEKKFRYLR